jgi:hypothetical protein
MRCSTSRERFGIAKDNDADQETPVSTDISAETGDTGSDPVEFPLGKPGEDLNS